MVDLLSDKQYKQIMTTVKKKVNIFRNKLQKAKQNFRETKYRIIKNWQKESAISTRKTKIKNHAK